MTDFLDPRTNLSGIIEDGRDSQSCSGTMIGTMSQA
jgi:hypothetical protein